ncbi:MAG: NUMOD4 motif-containing HNH endonuclease [Alphaproteobacteria bacterium]
MLPGLLLETPRGNFRVMTNSAERWKVVEGFPDYEISDLGRLRTWRRKSRVWRSPRSARRDEPIVTPGSATAGGYRAFILRRPGETKPHRRLAHRLVAFAFLGPPPSAAHTDVAHSDGNPSNNRVSNLRWATHRDNQMDMRRHGTMMDGEKCITAKLTAEQVRAIRQRVAADGRGSQRRISEETGLSPAQICRIVKNTRWRHLD